MLCCWLFARHQFTLTLKNPSAFDLWLARAETNLASASLYGFVARVDFCLLYKRVNKSDFHFYVHRFIYVLWTYIGQRCCKVHKKCLHLQQLSTAHLSLLIYVYIYPIWLKQIFLYMLSQLFKTSIIDGFGFWLQIKRAKWAVRINNP